MKQLVGTQDRTGTPGLLGRNAQHAHMALNATDNLRSESFRRWILTRTYRHTYRCGCKQCNGCGIIHDALSKHQGVQHRVGVLVQNLGPHRTARMAIQCGNNQTHTLQLQLKAQGSHVTRSTGWGLQLLGCSEYILCKSASSRSRRRACTSFTEDRVDTHSLQSRSCFRSLTARMHS